MVVATLSPSFSIHGSCFDIVHFLSQNPVSISEIRDIVESSKFDEFDITTQIDILDTSKKKIEEIKRKSQEQVLQQMEVDKDVTKDAGADKHVEKNDSNEEKVKKGEDEMKVEVAEEKLEEKIQEKWLEGEKILCFHGPLIYEAKIQRVEVRVNFTMLDKIGPENLYI